MLVLISFGLVLVATVLLVIGLMADSGLGFIYVSIACSLAAGIILVVATRANRPRAEAVSSGPAPLPTPDAPTAPPAVTTAVAAAPAVTAAPATAPDEEFAPTASVPATPAVDDDLFPIADYDDLSLGEILPLLPKLYADELDVVEAREKAGKSRRQIISRLGELRESMEGAPDDLTAEEWAAQQPAATRAPARRAPAKKVVAAAPAKKATPTKKAAAPTKKVAAATKKAAAPTKKVAAATKKAAAPAKKATPTKKAAAPAKKAAKKAAAPAKKTAKATKKS